MKQQINRGRHAKTKSSNKKRIFFILFALILLVIAISYFYILKDEPKIVSQNENNVINTAETNDVLENLTKEPETVDVDLPDKMGNYSVIGELVIDKIEVKKNILEKTDKAALRLSVTKFYGPNVNEIGNFCLCGHNTSNMLQRLKELEIGDTMYLINKETKTKITYEIYQVDRVVNPDDVSCLDQDTNGKREVTIYTCNPGGLTRLVYKAREI